MAQKEPAQAGFLFSQLVGEARAFRSVLTTEPDHAGARRGLDDAIRRLEQLAARALGARNARLAIEAYSAALQLRITPAAADYERLGSLLHLVGERDAAIARFREGAALEPGGLLPVREERGQDPDVLVIGFTGFVGRISMRIDFLSAAGLERCSRLLLWDPGYLLFLKGLPGTAEGYAALVELIRGRIAALAPRKVIVVGCSASGFGALLYGHAIGADAVHAFSPPVTLDPAHAEKVEPDAARRFRALLREIAAARIEPKLLRLADVLATNNGKTRFFVHYGSRRREDAERARRLEGLPGVHLIAHEVATHRTAEALALARRLPAVFSAADPLDIPRIA